MVYTGMRGGDYAGPYDDGRYPASFSLKMSEPNTASSDARADRLT